MDYFKNSIDLFQQASKIIPAGCSTLAKSPVQLIEGVSPYYCIEAAGCRFIDVDGNTWIDCEMAMGSAVWGYGVSEINGAILRQLNRGMTFSLGSPDELELAKKILMRYQNYKSLKFFKNGADAVYSCVRLSRYLSRKSLCLYMEYHGWLDWCSYGYYQKKPHELGIPFEIEDSNVCCALEYEDVMRQINTKKEHLACVVISPVSFSKSELRNVLDICEINHIHVIFDEVSTGVRYGKPGVTGAYGLKPDFLCVSKGLANGLPLAVAMSKTDNILKMEYLKISNAHASESLSIAAALACEGLLESSSTWPVWKIQSERIMNNVHELLLKRKSDLVLKGYHGSFYVTHPGTNFYKDPFRIFMLRYFSDRRIFTRGYILFSHSHTEADIQYVGDALLECVDSYLRVMF